MRATSACLAPGFFKRSLDEFKRLSNFALKLEGLKSPSKPFPLILFNQPEDTQLCKRMSDKDIGGYSTANFDFHPVAQNEPPHVRFHGSISTQLPPNQPHIQRTGYAGWRTLDRGSTIFGKSLWDVSMYGFLAIQFKSDGRKYFVNVQTESIVPTDIHQHLLHSKTPGEWETILIKWNEFVRTNHGQVVEPQREMLTQKVRTVGISLIDRIPGPYDLSISKIWATNATDEDEFLNSAPVPRLQSSEQDLKSAARKDSGFGEASHATRMTTPRYLTAQKISLLVLTRLYCTSPLPSSATIPILSFILSNSLPSAPSSARPQPSAPTNQQDTSFSIDAFEDVLQEHASSMPGRTLLDLFLKQMWEMNSFDALHALFDSILEIVTAPPPTSQDEDSSERIYLSKTSPLGAFVRRAHLEFTRLQFDDSMKLWSSFIKYRAPTAQWTKRLAGLASGGVDVVISEMGLRSGDDVYEIAYGHLEEQEEQGAGMSLDDLDRVLEFQLDRLQRFGDRVPDEMKGQLRSMVSSSGLVHRQAHLVQFFDAWKAGDYTSAFDNLHRYYDYAMQTREKIFYQYALLHMAILQADFGCFGEAIAAINETIATARENQDMTCLSFSLSWLNHMAKAYPKQMRGAGYMSMLGSERDALMFLKAKAKEAKMYNLLSASLLNEAKLSLTTGDSIPRALEHIYQSSHLNIKEIINSYGSQMLLTAVLYNRLGIPHLSNVHCELLLDCYSHSCPVEERLRAIGRRAFITSQSGRYDEAIAMLEAIDPSIRKSLKFHQFLVLCIGLIKLRRAIRRCDWPTAKHLLETLKPASSPSSPPLDPEMSFIQHEIYVDYLVSTAQFSLAYQTIASLAQSLKDDNADIQQRVSVLLMQADLWIKVGKPERGFSVALRAAGALEGGDNMLIGTLYSHLADSYMGLANPNSSSSAAAVNRPVTPLTPKVAPSPSPRSRSSNIAKAELYIDRARDCFMKAGYLDGECEQMMKRAIIAKLRGDEKVAEEWAMRHNSVWEEGLAAQEG
ncbi:anaphase-promoting complex protein [Stemphylium lycopersici]|uniref:Anaphase-promoting complex subunit 5 n=1 Tax=Stemphylium lycopersici TaxID=183478 RepID=A0A364NE79_STELY|nr:anaphase-promoting complex protein [Stemphylium lycopersici]